MNTLAILAIVAAPVDFSFSPASQSARPGEIVTVTLQATGEPGFSAASACLRWEGLELVSHTDYCSENNLRRPTSAG
jgi:hypothetical protein